MIIKNNGIRGTFDKLCHLLSSESMVYYSRFGDGDFNIISGLSGELYHDFSPELQKELTDAFMIEDPKYLRGVMVSEEIFSGSKLVRRGSDEKIVTNFIERLYPDRKEIVVDSHVLLTYISVCEQEKMIDFLNKFIRPKRKLFLGSVEKEKIEKLVGKIDYYVHVPCTKERVPGKLTGAYYYNHLWWPEVLKHIDDVELVLPSAGMAGRVLAKRLWYMGKKLHCIELGSVVDGATGIKSRSIWNRDDNLNKLKNLLLKEV